jgi:hypothetical protein
MLAGAWAGAGLPDPGGVLVAAAGASAWGLLWLAHLAAAVPAGVLRWPWFGAPHVAAYYAAAGVFLAGARWGVRWQSVALAAGLCGALVLLIASRPDGRLHLAFFDSPGAGALVTAPDGATMLIDTGSSASALTRALDARLGPLRRLDAVLLTGSGRSTAGGVAGLDGLHPPEVMLPGSTDGDAAEAAASAFERGGSLVRRLDPGDVLLWHGLRIEVRGCGPGLALAVRWGTSGGWICAASRGLEAAAPPVAGFEAYDLGDGGGEPPAGLPAGGWVVIHGSRGGRGALGVAALGPRLWRTARDGPLELACDRGGCHR